MSGITFLKNLSKVLTPNDHGFLFSYRVMVYRAYFRYKYDVILMSMTSSPFADGFSFNDLSLLCGLPPLNFWWWNVFFNVNICTSFSMSIYVLLVWGFFNFDDLWARFKALAASFMKRLYFSSFHFANSGESPPPRGSGPGCPRKCSFLTRRRSISFFAVFWLIWPFQWLSGLILVLLDLRRWPRPHGLKGWGREKKSGSNVVK